MASRVLHGRGFRPAQAVGIGAGLLTLVVAVWGISSVAGYEHVSHGVATSALILMCGVCVLYDLHVFGSNLFSPLVVVSLNVMVFFGLGPWFSAITANQLQITTTSRAQLTSYIAMAMTLLLLGYIWGGKQDKRQAGWMTVRPWNRKPVVWTALLFTAAGAIGVALYLSSVGGIIVYLDSFGNRISNWNKGQGLYVMLLESGQTAALIWCVFLFSSPPASARRAASRVAFTVMLLVVVSLMRLVLGSRTGLLWPFLACMLLYNNHRRRVTVIELMVVVGCAVGVIYAYGEVRVRLGQNQGAETLRDMTVVGPNATEDIRAQYGEMLDVTLAIIDSVPVTVPYQLGKTYALGFAYVVPRQLWPDKPPSAAELLSDVIYAGSWNGSSYITPGLWGEAYLNFGYIGWLIVPLLLGVVLRKLGDFGLRGAVTPTASVMYVFAFQFANGIAIGDFVNLMVRLLPQLALAWGACHVLDVLAAKTINVNQPSQQWRPAAASGLSR